MLLNIISTTIETRDVFEISKLGVTFGCGHCKI
jgi:hypothetical protein